MTIADIDLELLEEHLDGALDLATESKLRQRLGSEPALSAALAELQSQRDLRVAAYRSMELGDVTAQQLIWRVRGAMLAQQPVQEQKPAAQTARTWGQWRIARLGSAAAACVVFGFFAGRLGRSGAVAPASPAGVVAPGQPGSLIADYHPTGFTPVASAPRISVPITNEYGQVVAWQTFDNPEQAKNFAEDLGHAHAQQPAGSVQPKLVDAPQPF